MNQTTNISQSDDAVRGSALLRELREGWAPLPNSVVLSLVLAGLRVRLSRSVVTMVTVVLAIAFLTYTGLSGKLSRNLAVLATQWSEVPAVPVADIESAVASQSQVVLWPSAAGSAVSSLSIWIPDTASELREQRKAAKGTTQEAVLTTKLKLRQAFESGQTDGETETAAKAFIDGESRKLWKTLRTAGAWSELELAQAAFLLKTNRLDEKPRVVLGRVIANEKTKRAGVELSSFLRKAGVNIEATLRGETSDTWVIVMALMLCTVGIANAMLMNVTERFREIGTMKCLGSQDSLVVKLFILESAFLGVTGAILGIVLGVLVTLLAGWLQYGGYVWDGFSFWQGMGVMVSALLAGIVLAVAGTLYPAVLAARMRPVDALRIDE